MKQPYPLFDADEVHVHLVGGPLQLENRGLPPLVEQQVARIEKTRDPHDDQKQGHGDDQQDGEALLQAGGAEGHLAFIPSRNMPLLTHFIACKETFGKADDPAPLENMASH